MSHVSCEKNDAVAASLDAPPHRPLPEGNDRGMSEPDDQDRLTCLDLCGNQTIPADRVLGRREKLAGVEHHSSVHRNGADCGGGLHGRSRRSGRRWRGTATWLTPRSVIVSKQNPQERQSAITANITHGEIGNMSAAFGPICRDVRVSDNLGHRRPPQLFPSLALSFRSAVSMRSDFASDPQAYGISHRPALGTRSSSCVLGPSVLPSASIDHGEIRHRRGPAAPEPGHCGVQLRKRGPPRAPRGWFPCGVSLGTRGRAALLHVTCPG